MFMKLTVWPEEMARIKILFLLEINLNDISSHSAAKMIWSKPTLRAKLYMGIYRANLKPRSYVKAEFPEDMKEVKA